MSDGNGRNGQSEDVYARVASSTAARSQQRPVQTRPKPTPSTGPAARQVAPSGPSAPTAAPRQSAPRQPAPQQPDAAVKPPASRRPAEATAEAKPGFLAGVRAKLAKVPELTARATGKDDDPAPDQPAPVQSAPASTAVATRPAGPTTVGTRSAVVPAVPVGQPKAAAAVAVAVPVPLETPKPKVGVARSTRKARLRLARVDPWSVMKTAFLFSIAGGVMLVVGVYALWTVISGSGLFDNINEIIANVVSTPGDTTPFQVENYVNTAKVMGITAFLACIDVVILTALATLGAFLYNLAATMLGGLEITLAED